MTDAFIIVRRGSSLSASISNGIGYLHFTVHKNAEVEVTVDGKSMGIFKPVRQGGWDNHYFRIKDLNKKGDVTVELLAWAVEPSWIISRGLSLIEYTNKTGFRSIMDKEVIS